MACSDIFCRLYNVGVKRGSTDSGSEDTDRKEYSNPSKDGACRGECLHSDIKIHSNDYGLDFRDVRC